MKIRIYLMHYDSYIVIGIPNSGIVSAKEYAEYLGIRYEQLIRKNKMKSICK